MGCLLVLRTCLLGERGQLSWGQGVCRKEGVRWQDPWGATPAPPIAMLSFALSQCDLAGTLLCSPQDLSETVLWMEWCPPGRTLES